MSSMEVPDTELLMPNPNASVRKLADGEGAVALIIDTGSYFQLNEFGFLLWELVGDGLTAEELVRKARDAVPGVETLERDVRAFLSDVIRLGLLQPVS